MAYIAPNSTVFILSNVPLNNQYIHTVLFTGNDANSARTAQHEYFVTKMKYRLDNQSYQRVNQNTLRLQIPADSLYDCNYLMFQNTSYSGKWFYAFLTEIRYINNAVSEIEYQIDVMQTWLVNYDYAMGRWFVEREHSVTDNLYENTEAENLDLGEDYITYDWRDYDLSELGCCVLATMLEDESKPTAQVINNNLIGLHVVAGTLAQASTFVQDMVDAGLEDAIVSIYTYPLALSRDATQWESGTSYMKQAIIMDRFTNGSFGSYTPMNKKLYTFPYCKIEVSNNMGEQSFYKFENFNYYETQSGTETRIRFNFCGCYLTNPCVICYPVHYLGVEEAFDYSLILNNFPTGAFSGDAFKAWLAQNKGSIISNIISGTLSLGLSASSGSLSHSSSSGFSSPFNESILSPYKSIGSSNRSHVGVNGGVNLSSPYEAVLSTIGKQRDLEHTPPSAHGQVNCDSLNAAMKRFKFTIRTKTIKAEYAKIADEFFTMYGYATNRVKHPNISSRPHWNYIKTANAFVTGLMPQDDAKLISDIFNNGITFWKNPNEVGSYALDNRPSA